MTAEFGGRMPVRGSIVHCCNQRAERLEMRLQPFARRVVANQLNQQLARNPTGQACMAVLTEQGNMDAGIFPAVARVDRLRHMDPSLQQRPGPQPL